MFEIIKSHWEGIVAILALVTSVTSTLLTYRALKLQRIHNAKSLKPILYLSPFDYENSLKILLANNGVGPAIITNIQVEKNQHEIKPSIIEWLPEKLPNGMNYKEYLTESNNITLNAGNKGVMLELYLNPEVEKERTEREKIRGILRQLTVKIEYSDIYENQMPIYEKKLDLFGRSDNENSTKVHS
jgi:hypothetical protein